MSSFSVKHIQDHIAFYSRHNFLLYRQIRKIQSFDQLSAEELTILRKEETMKLIRYAVSKSPFYKERYRSVNIDGSFEEVYPSLPILTKDDVKANGVKMATVPLRFLKKAYTSGTSGSPLTVYRSPAAILKENAYVWYLRMKHGLQMGAPYVSMRGVLDNRTLSYHNKAENALYLSSYQLSKNNIHKYAALLEQFKPRAICAFPSSVFALANLLDEAGIKINIPLVFTSSETLYPFQRQRIENSFDGKIADWYGNAERSIALAQDEEGYYRELPVYSNNEFLEKGVITTSLINKSFPLIRYYVDDTFEKAVNHANTGQGIAIRSVEGRVDDVVILPDGTQVGRLGVAFQGVGNLRYAQIVQEENTSIRINLVVTPQFGPADQEILLNKLRQRLNNSLIITFSKIDEDGIVKSRSGKFKLVVSRLLNPNQ